MERCQIVSEQLLECFAIALGEEPDYFVRVGALHLGSSTAAVWRPPGKQLTDGCMCTQMHNHRQADCQQTFRLMHYFSGAASSI